MTLTLIARNPFTREIGVAIASGSDDCTGGSLYAADGRGLVSVQAKGNSATGAALAQMMRDDIPSDTALEQIREADRELDFRQVLYAPFDGDLRAFTGAQCLPWAGQIVTEHYILAGNMLAGESVLKKMEKTYLDGLQAPLRRRLLAALQAGIAGGGDLRGHRSGGVIILGDKPFSAIAKSEVDVLGALAASL